MEKLKEAKKMPEKYNNINNNSQINQSNIIGNLTEDKRDKGFLNKKRNAEDFSSNLKNDYNDEKALAELKKLDILANENKRIEEMNITKKKVIDDKLHELLDYFKKGENKTFISKFIELEKFSKTKENFFEKSINLKNLNINSSTIKDDQNINSQSQSDQEEESIDSGKLRKENFEENADAKFAYDKNREFLNTDINLRLKSDLNLMNKFNNFEEGLNMSKSLIDYSNTIHEDHYDNEKKTAVDIKQQNKIKGN